MHAYLWCFSVLLKIVRPISGESSTKLPIWGHHTQIHRFYGIKRWNTMRKKNLFLEPPIPPWSRWPSDSGKLRGSKNKSILNFTCMCMYDCEDFFAQKASWSAVPILYEWLLLWPLQLSWLKSYGAYESWLREQKGVVELSGCMDTTVGTGMFMWIKVRSTSTYALRLPVLELELS